MKKKLLKYFLRSGECRSSQTLLNLVGLSRVYVVIDKAVIAVAETKLRGCQKQTTMRKVKETREWLRSEYFVAFHSQSN